MSRAHKDVAVYVMCLGNWIQNSKFSISKEYYLEMFAFLWFSKKPQYRRSWIQGNELSPEEVIPSRIARNESEITDSCAISSNEVLNYSFERQTHSVLSHKPLSHNEVIGALQNNLSPGQTEKRNKIGKKSYPMLKVGNRLIGLYLL